METPIEVGTKVIAYYDDDSVQGVVQYIFYPYGEMAYAVGGRIYPAEDVILDD